MMSVFFLYLRGVKLTVMKHGAYKYRDFAGCKKNPVAVFAPVCFTIGIDFL